MDGHASRGLPLADEPAAASTRSTSRWLDAGDLRTPVAAFAVSRALLFGFAWASLRLSPGLAFGTRAFPSQPWLDGWVRWDSFWYLEIALSGYRWTPGQESTVHFLPLFPMLARLAAIPLRPALDDAHAVLAAGVALALASFLVGLVGVRRLGRDLVGETAAERDVRRVLLGVALPRARGLGALVRAPRLLADRCDARRSVRRDAPPRRRRDRDGRPRGAPPERLAPRAAAPRVGRARRGAPSAGSGRRRIVARVRRPARLRGERARSVRTDVRTGAHRGGCARDRAPPALCAARARCDDHRRVVAAPRARDAGARRRVLAADRRGRGVAPDRLPGNRARERHRLHGTVLLGHVPALLCARARRFRAERLPRPLRRVRAAPPPADVQLRALGLGPLSRRSAARLHGTIRAANER